MRRSWLYFANRIRAAQGTGLDLAAVRRHGDVRDGRVLSLPERWLMTAGVGVGLAVQRNPKFR